MTRKSWRDLNPRRRINRKLTGSTVDLRKPPSKAERAALSHKRVTISAIQRGELHIVKPRSAKMSRSLKAAGAKRLKGSRLLVPDRRQSFDDYLNSIGYAKDYSGHQNVKLAYLNKRGELKYVTVSGRRWEAVVQWKVAAANDYDDLIRDFKDVRLVDDEGMEIHVSTGPEIIRTAMEDEKTRDEMQTYS
jgi:hypothetical protein